MGEAMHELTIKVPSSITLPIEVEWGADGLINEPLGKTEILDILNMTLRVRVLAKRAAGDERNFYGATDTDTAHG